MRNILQHITVEVHVELRPLGGRIREGVGAVHCQARQEARRSRKAMQKIEIKSAKGKATPTPGLGCDWAVATGGGALRILRQGRTGSLPGASS